MCECLLCGNKPLGISKLLSETCEVIVKRQIFLLINKREMKTFIIFASFVLKCGNGLELKKKIECLPRMEEDIAKREFKPQN